jgi:hypothetical protein
MAKDKQSESSKLDQKNEAMDKAQEEGRKRYEKQEIEDNQAPRKAVGEAVGKAVNFAKGVKDTYMEGVNKVGDDLHRIVGTERGKQLNKDVQEKERRGIDLEKLFDADRQRKHTEALAADQAQGAAARGMTTKDFVRSQTKKANKVLKLEEDTDSGYKKGGKVSSASKRADGCAIRGKTRA